MKKMTILIADPDTTNRLVFKHFFTLPGHFSSLFKEKITFKFVEVSEARELKKLLEGPDSYFDIVLVNTDLPRNQVMTLRLIGQLIKAQNEQAVIVALNSTVHNESLGREIFLIDNPEFTDITLVPVVFSELLTIFDKNLKLEPVA